MLKALQERTDIAFNVTSTGGLMSFRTHLLYPAVLIGMTACAAVDRVSELSPSTATEAEAIKLAGKPTYVWNNPDGTRTLEFTDQPFDGNSTWMLTVDAEGKVIRRILVSIDDARVPNGLSTDDVRRLIGTPRTISHYPLPNEDIWDWNMRGTRGDVTLKRFNVHFKGGKVVRTSVNTVTECTMFSC
jgi:hypothetical protein